MLNEGENVKLEIRAFFDGLHVFNRDSIRPSIHWHGQPVWGFLMPPVKTRASPRLGQSLARRRVESKKRRTFLYRCESLNGMMTRGLGNRLKLQKRIQCTLSYFGSPLSNCTSLQREFSKIHAWVQINCWCLRDTFNLRFCRPGIPNFLSTSDLSSITVERHRC